MKAILIDSKNKTVTEVEITEGRGKSVLDQWYEMIGCRIVEVATYINDTDSILVDEEGLIKGDLNNDTAFFTFEGYPQPLKGNGLITGVNEDGDSISPIVSVANVKNKVTFYSMKELYEKGML